VHREEKMNVGTARPRSTFNVAEGQSPPLVQLILDGRLRG
jgi:hypothetical protein